MAMPALAAVGVQLVADNADNFLDIFNNIASKVLGVADNVGQFEDAWGSADAQLEQSGKTMEDNITVMDRLSYQGLIIANVIGNLLTSAIQSAVSMLQQIQAQAMGAVQAMQDMEITLQTLVAGEVIMAGATEDMATAIGMAEPIVSSLMVKLEELSVQSPFEYQQILSVFQMNKSFGMATEMAFETTRAITNLAATMKGVPGITSRLSYNFSQMSMIGKITGRDLRDLRMAGLDLEKVFQKQLGKTVKEVNAELAAGTMIFDDVSKAFVSYVDKYIGPAAERASRTLGGLKSTINDIAFFAWGNLFKNAGDEIAVGIGTILDAALNILRSQTMKEFGVVLGVIAKGIAEFAIDMFAPFIKSSENFDKYMAGRAEAMFDWGLGLVEQFANGIIAGLNYMANAMAMLGQMLAEWLMPMSPPKVAPQIDKWGLNTAREWLKGFTEVDYDILKSMQGPIQSVLSTLDVMGMMGAGEQDQTFANMSKDIIGALAGDVSIDSVIEKAAKIAGPFGEDLSRMVELQFAMGTATNKAAEAQEKLNKAQKDYFSAGQKVSKQVEAYNDLLRAGADKATLKAKLAEINVSKKDQKIAADKINAAAKEQQAAQEASAIIEKQISMQQKMIDTLLELANAEARAAKAREDAAKKGGGGKPTAGQPTVPTPKVPNVDDILAKKMEELRIKLEGKLNAIRDMLELKMNEAKVKMLIQWYDLKKKILAVWSPIESILKGEGVTTEQIVNIAKLFGISEEDVTSWTQQIEDVKKVWNSIFGDGGEITDEQVANVGELFGLTPDQTQSIIDTITEIKTKFDEIVLFVQTDILPIIPAIMQSVMAIVAAFGAAQQTLAPFFETFGVNMDSTGEKTSGVGEIIISIIGFITRVIIGAIYLATMFIARWMALITIIQAFQATIKAGLDTVITVMSAFGLTIAGIFMNLFQIILAIAWAIISSVLDIFTNGGQGLKDIWASVGTFIMNKLNEIKMRFITGFLIIKNAITGGINKAIEMGEKVGEQISLVMGFSDDFKQNFSENLTAIQGFFDDLWGKVESFWSWLTNLKWPSINIQLPNFQGVVDAVGNVVESIGGSGIDTTAQDEADTMTPGKAAGGPVTANKPYIVGEEGPEWFVPPNSGRIIPNHMPLPSRYMGSGGNNVTNSVTIEVGNVTITNAQEGEMFEQRVERAVRNALK